MIAVDTSVVVAAFASWHEGHAAAQAVLSRRPRLIAHVAIETYSVLTRLPPPHRASPSSVADFLTQAFAAPSLVLAPEACLELIVGAARNAVAGGAIYDALVGATARNAGATLLTRDRRAIPTYQALGVAFEVAN